MADHKLRFKNYFGYGIGDIGFNLLFTFANIYLLIFYTDVFGISATVASFVFFIGRFFWDAITDPIIGWLADRTKTRWGSYRPFVLFGAIPLAVSFAMMFYTPDLSENGKIAYAIGTFMLFNLAFTIGNVPYGTLIASLTEDYAERSRLAGFRMTLGVCGGFVGAAVAAHFLGLWDAGAAGYFKIASIFALILVLTSLITFSSVKERVQVIRKKVSLFKALSMIRKNRPFISLTLCFFFNYAALYLILAIIPYYFQYYLQQPDLQGRGLALIYITAGLSIPAWVWVAKRAGKHNVYLFGGIAYIIGLVGLFLSPAGNMVPQYIFMGITALGAGSSAFAGWAMLADTIEFGEWASGIRVEALLFGIFGFFFKLGSGLGQALAAWGLDIFQYQYPIKALDGTMEPQAQSDLTLEGISMILSLVPAALILASMIALAFYEISPEQHRRLLRSLGRGENS
jgi:GPH family glycoside/pentoside/hexuronide:cation symporter